MLNTEINWQGLGRSFYRRQIRILDGDYAGKAGWLADKKAMTPDENTPSINF